jgi:hypothetical protein
MRELLLLIKPDQEMDKQIDLLQKENKIYKFKSFLHYEYSVINDDEKILIYNNECKLSENEIEFITVNHPNNSIYIIVDRKPRKEIKGFSIIRGNKPDDAYMVIHKALEMDEIKKVFEIAAKVSEEIDTKINEALKD